MSTSVKISPSVGQLVNLRRIVRHAKKNKFESVPVKLTAGKVGKGSIEVIISPEEIDKVQKAIDNKTGVVINVDSKIQTTEVNNKIAGTLHKVKGSGGVYPGQKDQRGRGTRKRLGHKHVVASNGKIVEGKGAFKNVVKKGIKLAKKHIKVDVDEGDSVADIIEKIKNGKILKLKK